MASEESPTPNPTEEDDDLAKLQAEIAQMEAEAARIAKETEDLDTSASAGGAAKSSAATAGGSKGEGKEDKVNKDG